MANISNPLQARPTIYKGIEMRSRLEAKWAARLDVLGVEWLYEPWAFADERQQYLPDFLIVTKEVGRFSREVIQFDFDPAAMSYVGHADLSYYIDVKGVVTFPVPILERMSVIWRSDEDAELLLIEGDGERQWWASSPSRSAGGPNLMLIEGGEIDYDFERSLM